MAKQVELQDGSQVTIRPMTADDVERSFAFFQGIPEEDRIYLRADVTKREAIERRTAALETGRVQRVVAVSNEAIVADGTLELEAPGWKEGVGELRLFVLPAYRRKGLGMLMAGELYTLASSARVNEIVVKMMRPQVAARNIFHKLGFREEMMLADYVKDLRGHRQDFIMMRCDLDALWKELEHFYADSDWQRTR